MSRRVAIGCHDSFKQRVDSTSVVPAAGSSCVAEPENAIFAYADPRISIGIILQNLKGLFYLCRH